MTEDWSSFVCSRLRRGVRVPRTQPTVEWEAMRHAHEAAYWAAHFDEFITRLPGIRSKRGEARAARLVRDVLAAVGSAQGDDAAVFARDRLDAQVLAVKRVPPWPR